MGAMNSRLAKPLKVAVLVLLYLALVVVCAAAMHRVKAWWKPYAHEPQPSSQGGARLATGDPHPICLSADVVQTLSVRADARAEPAKARRLEMSGSLAPDTDHLAPVRSRFPGEVVAIGKVRDPDAPTTQER